jgi:predicted amidohydrolase
MVLAASSPCSAVTDPAAAIPSSLSAAIYSTLLTKETKLTASDPQTNQDFGVAVSVSGDTAVVGADLSGSFSGAAYVFVRSAGIWHQQQKLTASDPGVLKEFGRSVAVSGDTAVIGSPGDSDAGTFSGAAYVFVRSGGVWNLQQKLTASDASALDEFGWSVAVSGDTVVVGSPNDDHAGNDSGAAYVFVRSGSIWHLQQKLLASNAAANDEFGLSVAVSGDTVVVGCPRSDESGALFDSGSADVFVRKEGVWSQQQQLTADDVERGVLFGASVAVSGDLVAVGSPLSDDAGFRSGSAYVFARHGGIWIQQQKLMASDAAADDEFGYSVGISSETTVIGTPFAHNAGGGSGLAYVFALREGVWHAQQKLMASDTTSGDGFGFSVAIGGATVVAGAPGHPNGGVNSGSAYVYEPELTALSPAKVWVGLKNSDDAGLRLDLKAEVFQNGSLIGSGEVDGVSAGGSGFNRAILDQVALTLSAPVVFLPGDTLSIKVSVRAGATGHRSGTARLWFNDSAADSRFDATIGGASVDLYLLDGFVLGTSPGPGPKRTIDVFVDRAAGGNPFKSLGTWSKTF